MCITQRENVYSHVAQTWIRYILCIEGDFGINRMGSDVENATIFELQSEHLATLVDYRIGTK